MKLQKHISRKAGNKTYVKWIVNIPDNIINELNWKQGVELKSEISNNKLLLFVADETIEKSNIKSTGDGKLSFFERFVLVYDSLPIGERKLPIVVVDGEPISWVRCYSEIRHKTKLGSIIGKKLIKLQII